MEKGIFFLMLPGLGPGLGMYLVLPAALSVGLAILPYGWGN